MDDELYNETEHERQNVFTCEPRPWVRYFARMIDLYMGGFVIAYIWERLFPESYFKIFGNLNSYFTTVILYLVWLVVESFLIAGWGITPGKWVFSTRVISIDGGNLKFTEAIRRSFLMFLYGMGLCIPLANIITMVLSYDRLRDRKTLGVTKWDSQCRSAAVTGKLNPLKIILSVIISISIIFGVAYYKIVSKDAYSAAHPGANAISGELQKEKERLEKEEQFLTNWQIELQKQYDAFSKLDAKMKLWEDQGDTQDYNYNIEEYNRMFIDYNADQQQYEKRRLKFNQDADLFNKKILGKSK